MRVIGALFLWLVITCTCMAEVDQDVLRSNTQFQQSMFIVAWCAEAKRLDLNSGEEAMIDMALGAVGSALDHLERYLDPETEDTLRPGLFEACLDDLAAAEEMCFLAEETLEQRGIVVPDPE